MIDALTGLGFAVDEEMLARRAAQGQSIGRPHLAQAVVSRPENRQRLAEASLLDPTAFLVEYLIEGRPAFVPAPRPACRRRSSSSTAPAASPSGRIPSGTSMNPSTVIDAVDRFRGAGLDGVEAFYATHTEEQTRLLVDHASKLGLLTTGSSDFHGPEHHTFSRFRAFSTYGLGPVLGPLAG